MSKEIPTEHGYYWHKNGYGLWEIVLVEPSYSCMKAITPSGRELFGGEPGWFGERIPYPDEDEQ